MFMAKKGNTPSDVGAGFTEGTESDIKYRSYKNDGKGFDTLDEGQEIQGILVSIRDHEITDTRTRERKTIRVYAIRNNDFDTTLKIGGRAILDRIFDDIMDEHGGYTVESGRYRGPGYEAIKDKAIRIARGKDTRTAQKNPMGTYEVGVED
jgi:hypothetical protein